MISLVLIVVSCKHISTDLEEQEEVCINNSSFLFKQLITGDFDGDGVADKMNEVLFSSIDSQSIDMLPNLDYDSLIMWISQKEPVLYLKSDNLNIPDLQLTSQPSFGILWIKNEGDLNQNGRDEISVVIDWADWSALNHCVIYSLEKDGWRKWVDFPIREWQIHDNPDFNGFIMMNDKEEYEVLTFDEEGIETIQKLQHFVKFQ